MFLFQWGKWMQLRVEGEEAKDVFNSFMKLLASATLTFEALRKKWDWEAHEVESRLNLTDNEVEKAKTLSDAEYNARLAKARAEIAEADVRLTRAALQKASIARQNQQRRPQGRPQQNAARPMGERRPMAEGTQPTLQHKPFAELVSDSKNSPSS